MQNSHVKHAHINLGGNDHGEQQKTTFHTKRVDIMENPSYLKNRQEKEHMTNAYQPDSARRHYEQRDRDFNMGNAKNIIYQRD